MKRFCTYCGAPEESEAVTFCSQCGAKLPLPEELHGSDFVAPTPPGVHDEPEHSVAKGIKEWLEPAFGLVKFIVCLGGTILIAIALFTAVFG